MAFACNINRPGRVVRGVFGALSIVAGSVWLVVSWPPAWWGWIIGAVFILGGAFALIEARLSWCALRALGFRTPI